MGKSSSKEQHQDGITNVNVNLEEHLTQNQMLHDAHEWKLWLILVLCCIQVMYVFKKSLKKKWNRQGFNKVRVISIANINTAEQV